MEAMKGYMGKIELRRVCMKGRCGTYEETRNKRGGLSKSDGGEGITCSTGLSAQFCKLKCHAIWLNLAKHRFQIFPKANSRPGRCQSADLSSL